MPVSRAETLARWAFPMLVLLAVLIRWPTFLLSVVNHDESTYIVIGEGLLQGQTYLVDSFDTKPVGIFLLYALFSVLAGGKIFIIRLFTTLWLAATAYLLFLLGCRAGGHRRVGWAAGISYVLMLSIYNYYGLSPNTELFFNLFTVGAVLLVWDAGDRIGRYWLAGLALGCGFMLKYVVAADALAIGLLLLLPGLYRGQWWSTIARRCLPLTLAFFVPLACTYIFYAAIGQLDNFLFYTFEVTSRYPVETEWWRRLLFMGDFMLRYIPLVVFAYFALREIRPADRLLQRFCLGWLALATIVILIPGKPFGHYQIQLMPALALLAATWFHPERRRPRIFKQLPDRYSYGLLAALVCGMIIGLPIYYLPIQDSPREVATELEQRLGPGEQVYTGDYHHIIYHLLDQPPPTPYVHASLLFYDHHIRALDIDLIAEGERLLAQDKLRFVLMRATHPENEFTQLIEAHYTVVDTLIDDVYLWERNRDQ